MAKYNWPQVRYEQTFSLCSFVVIVTNRKSDVLIYLVSFLQWTHVVAESVLGTLD